MHRVENISFGDKTLSSSYTLKRVVCGWFGNFFLPLHEMIGVCPSELSSVVVVLSLPKISPNSKRSLRMLSWHSRSKKVRTSNLERCVTNGNSAIRRKRKRRLSWGRNVKKWKMFNFVFLTSKAWKRWTNNLVKKWPNSKSNAVNWRHTRPLFARKVKNGKCELITQRKNARIWRSRGQPWRVSGKKWQTHVSSWKKQEKHFLHNVASWRRSTASWRKKWSKQKRNAHRGRRGACGQKRQLFVLPKKKRNRYDSDILKCTKCLLVSLCPSVCWQSRHVLAYIHGLCPLATVKSQIFVRYLFSYFRTLKKSAKFNTGRKFIFVLGPSNFNVILF